MSKSANQWFSLPLIALPSIHIIVVALTMLLSIKTAGGAYYRIFAVDPLAAPLMMVDEGVALPVVGVILMFGTMWWYFIGRIGWASSKGRLSRVGSALGAILALFFVAIGVLLGKNSIYEDIQNGQLSSGAVLQYICVAAILTGAMVSAIYSARATFRARGKSA